MSKKESTLIGSTKSDTANQDPCNFAGCRRDHANPYAHELACIKKAKHALATAHFAPNPEGIKRAIYKQFPELNPKFVKEQVMPKKKPEKAQKKVEKILKEYKEGTLNIGKSDKKVKNRKQAVAIALSEAGLSKKKKRVRKKKSK